MIFRIILSFVLIFSLAGCATSGKKNNIQVQSLETQLDEAKMQLQQKDDRIRMLQGELQRSKMNFADDESMCKDIIKLSPKQIQAALNNAGYYDGPIDGKIGKNTKRSIRKFQEANGLKADGIIGKQTLLKLKKYVK